MNHLYKFLSVLLPIAVLPACATTKQEEAVELTPPPVEQTCIPINTLKKVVIPAVTKSGFSIVMIENPDEQYFDPETKKWVTIKNPPIERKEPWTKVIEPEKTIYVDAENKEVTDICELNTEKVNDTPQPVETAPEPTE